MIYKVKVVGTQEDVTSALLKMSVAGGGGECGQKVIEIFIAFN